MKNTPSVVTVLFYFYLTDRMSNGDLYYLLQWLTSNKIPEGGGSYPSFIKNDPSQALVEEIFSLQKFKRVVDIHYLWEKLCYVQHYLDKNEQQELLEYLINQPIDIPLRGIIT